MPTAEPTLAQCGLSWISVANPQLLTLSTRDVIGVCVPIRIDKLRVVEHFRIDQRLHHYPLLSGFTLQGLMLACLELMLIKASQHRCLQIRHQWFLQFLGREVSLLKISHLRQGNPQDFIDDETLIHCELIIRQVHRLQSFTLKYAL
jgi:hypothetical protein